MCFLCPCLIAQCKSILLLSICLWSQHQISWPLMLFQSVALNSFLSTSDCSWNLPDFFNTSFIISPCYIVAAGTFLSVTDTAPILDIFLSNTLHRCYFKMFTLLPQPVDFNRIVHAWDQMLGCMCNATFLSWLQKLLGCGKIVY